ncbi:MAG: ArdC family protein [Pseudonocardiaceae bacterium]
MSKHRTKYTEEQHIARDTADAAIRDRATELLTDPDAVAAMISHLMTTNSPKLLRYSMRNAAMLTTQAEERGMTLTDIDSFRGWIERGRCVRKGERGLRIVAPKGTESPGDDSAEQADQGDGEDIRVRFRMVTVFDISQTEGIEDAEAVDGEIITDPAAVLRATIAEQIERMGYTITTDQGEDPATVDDEAHTVTVPAGEPVPELARALACLVTRPKAERPTIDPATMRSRAGDATDVTGAAPEDTSTPDYLRRVRLPLGNSYGTADARIWTDWTTGHTYYKITAPRVTGTWTLSVHKAATSDTVRAINVDYGCDDGHTYYNRYRPRPNVPEINGITIHGATHGIQAETVDGLDRWCVNGYRESGGQAPARTIERLAVIVRAILRDWLTRPDLNQLHRACARHQAHERMQEAHHQARKLTEQIKALSAEQAQAEEQAQHFADIAADRNQPDLFALS